MTEVDQGKRWFTTHVCMYVNTHLRAETETPPRCKGPGGRLSQTPGTCQGTTETLVPPHTDAASSLEPSGGLGHPPSHSLPPLRPDQVPEGERGLPVSSHPQTVGARSPQTWLAAGLPCTSLCSGCRGPRPSSGRSACSPGWASLLCGRGACPPEEHRSREPPVSEQPPCPTQSLE